MSIELDQKGPIMSLDFNKKIDLSIAALEACRLSNQTYASGPEGAVMIEAIAKALAMNGEPNSGQFGDLPVTVAQAISRAYLNRDI